MARTEHSQVTTEFHREGDLDVRLRDELLAVARAHHAPSREFGFSMALGGLLSGDYPDCLVVVARDATGRPVAFQRYVHCRQGGALSLDSMRRASYAPNGVNERMIADTVTWARRHNITEVSLNFAAFRKVFDGTGEFTGAKAARAWLLRRMEGRFGIQMDTLGRFNAKFAPRWVPRYLVYRYPRDLPAIGLAALSAEGFLPFDAARNTRLRRAEAAPSTATRSLP